MKKAFSLVEIIIILFIISIGMLGVLSLIVQNIQTQTYNKNNLIAFQLAQEGVELIRMVRDSNWQSGRDFLSGLPRGNVYMDFDDTEPHVLESEGTNQAHALRLDDEGFYRHDGSGPSSGFSRLITLTSPDSNTLQVDVRITWKERNRDSSYDLQAVLYDWK